MSIIIKSGSSANTAAVDADNNLQTNLPIVPAQAGYAAMLSCVDEGSTTGTRVTREPEATTDYRLRVGMDSVLLSEAFLGTALNTAQWFQSLTTMTLTVSGGFARLNAGSSLTSGHLAILRSYRTFPLYGSFPTYFETTAVITGVQANAVVEIGAGLVAGTSAPTDGVFFRWASGEFRCVINNAGVETQSGVLTSPSVNERHKYSIVVGQDGVEFWVDDVLQVIIPTPAGLDSPTASNSQPMVYRVYNNNTVAQAVQILVADCFATLGDTQTGKPWPHVLAGLGGGSYQGQTGGTMGTTANYANSAAPASATGATNTTAGYATLGGQWQIAAPAGAETDLILFAFQVPAASNAISGKNLYVTGIRIDAVNTGAAVATTATIMQWGLGVGATAVTMATAEGAGTKASRRLTLGYQSFPVGAAIGAQATPIDVNFDAPLFVEAGNYLHVLLKIPVGTATGSQILRGVVFVNGYFE
jgi:hypothetical protein